MLWQEGISPLVVVELLSQGRYHGIDRLWLRWYDAAQWIPNAEEQALQAQQQVEQERHRTEAAQRQAEVAQQRAERLAARLREIGINPDQI
ncbi:MAG: hypothetical protein Kow00121_08700 [Elainellaceae cyanobacterium]